MCPLSRKISTSAMQVGVGLAGAQGFHDGVEFIDLGLILALLIGSELDGGASASASTASSATSTAGATRGRLRGQGQQT